MSDHWVCQNGGYFPQPLYRAHGAARPRISRQWTEPVTRTLLNTLSLHLRCIRVKGESPPI